MTFLRRFGLLALSLAAVASLTSCNKNPVINIPGPLPARLFVSQFAVGGINFVSRPFTPTSPVTTVATLTHPIGIAVDAAGNLFVSVGTGFTMFAAPVSTSSVPVTTPIAGASEPYGALIAQGGNLFITDANNNNLSVFSTPATAPTLVQTTAIASFSRPEGMSQDLTGRTFVAQEGNGTIVVLPTGFGVSPTPLAVITLPGGTSPVGLANDVHGNLFVADTGGNGIQVYSPPWATSTRAPLFTIAPPAGLTSPDFITFDPQGNLYVAYETGGVPAVAVFQPPFNGGTAASIILNIPDAVGIAFAP